MHLSLMLIRKVVELCDSDLDSKVGHMVPQIPSFMSINRGVKVEGKADESDDDSWGQWSAAGLKTSDEALPKARFAPLGVLSISESIETHKSGSDLPKALHTQNPE